MRCIFSAGREAWKETELRVMPKNSMDVLGPEVFSSERGTPSSKKASMRVVRPWRGGEDGGVTMRKSVYPPQYMREFVVVDQDPAKGF